MRRVFPNLSELALDAEEVTGLEPHSTETGAFELQRLTADRGGDTLATIVGRDVIAEPVVRTPLVGNSFQVTFE